MPNGADQEAVAEIARMFGWSAHLGHLCGGGTMANFEALWVARELQSGVCLALNIAHERPESGRDQHLQPPEVRFPFLSLSGA